VAVTLLDQSGTQIAALQTDAAGRLTIPAGLKDRITAAQFFSPGTGTVVTPVATGGIIDASAPAPAPTVIVYGQVLAPTGEGLGGVGVKLLDGDRILAASVTDPNGAWVLGSERPSAAQVTLVVNGSDPVALPFDSPATLIGPIISQLSAVPSARAGVAPMSALLTTDQATATEMMRRSPALWSRGTSAEEYDPCSPYAPADATLELRRFGHLVLFAAAGGTAKPMPLRGGTKQPGATAQALGLIEVEHQPSPDRELRYGMLFGLDQTWQGFGLALGDLIYSLPLAPCEEVNLAVVDWQAQQSGERVSTTAESVQQNLSFTRKRVIDAVVDSRTSRDWESSHLGATLSASYMGVTASATASHDWGNQLTVSSARSTQNLSDAIDQSAAVERDARMMTIVQVNESETSTASTRVVRNHNHAHTLTIQYYEVIERYLVTTKVATVDPVMLVPFDPIAFTPEAVDRHGDVLLNHLRDDTLIDELTHWLNRFPEAAAQADAAAAAAAAAAPPAATDDPLITLISLHVDIPDEPAARNAPIPPWSATDQLAGALRLVLPDAPPMAFLTALENPGGEAWTREFSLPLWPPTPLSRLAALSLVVMPAANPTDWNPAHYGLSLKLQHVDGSVTSPDALPDVHLPPGVSLLLLADAAAPVAVVPSVPVPTSPSPRLLAHLQANELFYTASILLDGDPLLLWSLLSQISTPDGPVTDVCDPDVIMVQGNYLVLRMASTADLPAAVQRELPAGAWAPTTYAGAECQTVVPLPSGGMFAEAQLGHCSAAEKIDDTVFWKWQDAPCDDSAPAITDEMIRSRISDMQQLLQFADTTLSAPTIDTPPEPDPAQPPGPDSWSPSSSSAASSSSSSSSAPGSSSAPSGDSSSGDSSSGSTGSAATIGIPGNPWIIDNYAVDSDTAPSDVTSDTASSLYAGLHTTSVSTLLAREIVSGIQDYLAGHPDSKVVITGYTDNSGSEAHNADLATRRAKNVHDALVAAHIDPSRIEYAGAGSTNPRSGFPDDATGHNAYNRRVEIYCH
jgi:hypothetical protein